MSRDTARDMALALMVALPRPNLWGSNCPAWIESADRKCGRPRTEGYLCTRHHTVAVKRYEKTAEQNRRQKARADAERERQLPKWRDELARVEKRMRQLDPPPPTDDLAAYGGVEVGAITRYQRRGMSDSRVSEMARLVDRRDYLRKRIGDA